MNKRIAVRLLKAAHEKIGVTESCVCYGLKNSKDHRIIGMKPSTVKEYELTLDNLYRCIDSQLTNLCTLRMYIRDNYENIPKLDCDMVKIRKAWILAMIEHIQEGKIPDNKFLTKFLNSL